MELDVVVPGRPTVDLVFTGVREWPEPGREVYADDVLVAAGAHFNTAAALARLGLDVALVAVVGDDLLGEIVLREVRSEGLPEEHVRVRSDVRTPLSAALNFAGDRGFVTYGEGHQAAEADYVAATRALLDSATVRIVHADLSAARYLHLATHETGAALSLDAHDAGPWLASDEVHDLVEHADLLFLNESEAVGMLGGRDPADAARELAAHCPHVVLKRGAGGSSAYVSGEELHAPALPAQVLDVTGAGDCFVAGYLWGHVRGESPATCLTLGNLCGRSAIAVPGGYHGAPTLDELLEAARERGVELA